MPVGTHATVKAVAPDDLEAMGASIVLSNTYHMLLRPGPELVARFGGLHGFMRWPHPILTDSGGFQVFSLGNLREVSDDGVRFRSHLDGSPVELTPERVMEVEALLGADIILPLDECPPFPCTPEVAVAATERTHRWAERALAARVRPQIRRFSASRRVRWMRNCGPRAHVSLARCPSTASRLAASRSASRRTRCGACWRSTIPELPDAKPRHLLGVGSPDDLLEGIERGVDMFDCVLPTRTARTGGLYTPAGRVNIRAARWREEQGPVDATCDCYTCRTFAAGYLHHLIRAEEDESRGELLYYRLASIHNLRFLIRLMEGARQALLEGTFPEYKARFMAGFTPPDREVAEEQRKRRGRAIERYPGDSCQSRWAALAQRVRRVAAAPRGEDDARIGRFRTKVEDQRLIQFRRGSEGR